MTYFTLSNGLTVYLLPSESPFAAVVLGYRVGGAQDPPEAIGVAHLLEHLLFEDDTIAYDSQLQAVGGTTNAYTGKDYTVYYARLTRQQVRLALELEAARLFDLQITEEKVAIQRSVVAEEFRQRYLNPPYADRFFSLLPAAFPGHPYQHMVIGTTPEAILSMPYEAVVGYYTRYYAPQHAVLCVAGGGIDEGLSGTIVQLFDRPKAAQSLPELPSTETLPLPSDTLVVVEREVPQPLVVWAFRLPPLEHPDIPAVDILDDFLGDSEGGFLVQRLVHQKRVASRIYTYVWSFHAGGLWIMEAYLPPKVGVAAYEQELQAALHQLLEENMEEVLSIYRPQRYLSLHKQREHSLGRGLALTHAVLAGHPEWYTDPLAPYEALQAEHLHQAIRRYLGPERRVRLHYMPRSNGAIG